jgi:hypothetical protein
MMDALMAAVPHPPSTGLEELTGELLGWLERGVIVAEILGI